MDTKLGGKNKTKQKKSQNYFFKQNKSTFILHKPGNHDQLEIYWNPSARTGT